MFCTGSSRYSDAMRGEGYDELDDLMEAEESDLQDLIKIVQMKTPHARKFLRIIGDERLARSGRLTSIGYCNHPFRRMRTSGRVLVVLPIAAPYCGKTTTIELLRKVAERDASFKVLTHLDRAQLQTLMTNKDLQAVIVVKSSDEFKLRMMKEHGMSEDAAGAKFHQEFWQEIANDFVELCKFSFETAVPTILIVDKNHMYNTFDKKKGLQVETHGWSKTMETLNTQFEQLQNEAGGLQGVELHYLALTADELFRGCVVLTNVCSVN